MSVQQEIKAISNTAVVALDHGATTVSPEKNALSRDVGASTVTLVPSATRAPRARRRTFSIGEKRRIVQEAEQCTRPDGLSALRRLEVVYSSFLSIWRRPMRTDAWDTQAPGTGRQNRKATGPDAQLIAEFTRERDQLPMEIRFIRRILEIQHSTAGLLELVAPTLGRKSA
jgi:transposase-like protein